MAKVEVMHEWFDMVDNLVNDMAQGNEIYRELLNKFFFCILSMIDGVEGNSVDWPGLRLVVPSDLPENVEEINVECLHRAWSERR